MNDFQMHKHLLLNFNSYSTEQVDQCLKELSWRFQEGEKIVINQEIIQEGLIPLFIDICNSQKISQSGQIHILFVLTNVCQEQEDQAQQVINSKGIDLFLKFSTHSCNEISVLALSGLGNICKQSFTSRAIILNSGLVDTICQMLTNKNPLLAERGTLIQVLSNLLILQSKPNYEKISQALPHFVSYIIELPDGKNLVDALSGLYSLTDYEELYLDSDVNLKKIVKCLIKIQTNSEQILALTFKTIGNLVDKTDQAEEYFILLGIIPWLIQQFEMNSFGHQEILWILGNIAAGTQDQQMYLLNLPQFINFMNQRFEQDQKFDTNVIDELYNIIVNLTQSELVCFELINLQLHVKLIQHKSRLIEYQTSSNNIESIYLEAVINLSKIQEAFDSNQTQMIRQHLSWSNDHFGDFHVAAWIKKAMEAFGFKALDNQIPIHTKNFQFQQDEQQIDKHDGMSLNKQFQENIDYGEYIQEEQIHTNDQQNNQIHTEFTNVETELNNLKLEEDFLED